MAPKPHCFLTTSAKHVLVVAVCAVEPDLAEGFVTLSAAQHKGLQLLTACNHEEGASAGMRLGTSAGWWMRRRA